MNQLEVEKRLRDYEKKWAELETRLALTEAKLIKLLPQMDGKHTQQITPISHTHEGISIHDREID